jgi:hypothetical protein
VIGAVAPILPAQRPARLCAAILDRRDTIPAPPFSTAVNMSAITFFNEVDRHRITLEKVVLDGLEMSLAHVWDFQNDLVADVYVDVESRSIRVADIHELMCEGDLPNAEGGIAL